MLTCVEICIYNVCVEVRSLFNDGSSRDRTQGVRPPSRCLHLLRHFIGSKQILNIQFCLLICFAVR